MPKFYSASQFTLLHHPLSHLIFTTTERKEDGIGTHILKARLLWETCMQVRKQQLEMDMEQQTGSKYEKEYVKAVYCHPAYLTSMQSTSWETLGWKKHKLESR